MDEAAPRGRARRDPHDGRGLAALSCTAVNRLGASVDLKGADVPTDDLRWLAGLLFVSIPLPPERLPLAKLFEEIRGHAEARSEQLPKHGREIQETAVGRVVQDAKRADDIESQPSCLASSVEVVHEEQDAKFPCKRDGFPLACMELKT
jgi:hypothetical protein